MADPISGVFSALFSALSLGNTLNKQQANLTVKLRLAETYPQGDWCLTVEVVNMSAFPVKITDIGFNRRDGKRLSHAFLGFALMNGQKLPVRLESRDSITALFPTSAVDPYLSTTAFATTACGVTEIADNADWKELRNEFAAKIGSR